MTFSSHRTKTSTNVSAVSKSDIVVVIPALNEAEAIGSVINELKDLGYDDILVVDGYSSDGTSEVAKRNGAKVVHQHGVGKTGALRTAIDYVDRPWILVMDGDFTYDPSSIELMLTHGKNYDEVIGARKGGVQHIPLVNRFGNWVIGWVFRLLFGSGLTDVCSGMYLLRTDVAKDLDLTTRGFDLEVEVASQLAAKGRITEVPINYRRRIGKKKLSLGDGLTIVTTVLRLANVYNPVLLYSGITALAALPGGTILVWVAYRSLFNHVWHSGYALFGVMLFLLATQAFTVATTSILINRSSQKLYKTLQDTRERENTR